MVESLLVVNAVLLLAMLGVYAARGLAARAARVEAEEAAKLVQGAAAEKSQTVVFYESSLAELRDIDSHRASHARRMRQVKAELEQRRSKHFVLTHQVGEPAKDKTAYLARLVVNHGSEATLSPLLAGLDHMAVVHAESEPAARRLLDFHFPPRAALLAVMPLRQGDADDV